MRKDLGIRRFPVSLFDSFFSEFQSPYSFIALFPETKMFFPDCDLEESESEYKIKADLPGIKKEDIKIELKRDCLIITGERKEEKRNDEKRITERSFGKFQRFFTLSKEVKKEGIVAEFKDGTLEIVLPKSKNESYSEVKIK